MLGQVHGRDHLIIGMLIQLGPRPEEQFVLRKNDVASGQLTVDEALVDGDVKDTKTEASAGVIYIPPGLQVELDSYLDSLEGGPEAWLFPASRKGVPMRPANFLRRVLKPAAVRAGIALRTTAKGDTTSGCNFQWLRRTSATLFGSRAKDPKLTQAHMRHADPQVTLQHYQQAIPAEVRAAALALENDLLAQRQKREAQFRAEVANARLV